MKTLRQVLTFTTVVALQLVSNAPLMGQSVHENPWGGLVPAQTQNLAYERYPVEGFAWPTSVLPGETIKFYISVMDLLPSIPDSGQVYEVRIFRSPDFDVAVKTFSDTVGRFYPLHDSAGAPIFPGDTTGRKPVDYKTGCKAQWDSTSVSFTIPSLGSGLYFARLNHRTLNVESQYYYIPFIVRASSPGASSKILFKYDWNTLQAYNYWGGGSLYSTGQDTVTLTPDSIIAFDRPVRRDFGRWITYASALEKTLHDSGYSMEYCNNIDLDSNGQGLGINLLANYQLLVLWNHDEYWSFDERQNTRKFKGEIESGLHGNIARFAANTCYWRVTWTGDSTGNSSKYLKLQCLKDNFPDTSLHDRDKWRKTTEGPEAKFLGSQYETGGNDVVQYPETDQPPDSVWNPSHWIFRNAQLTTVGQEFGFGIVQMGRRRGIISSEIDNALYSSPPFPFEVLAQRWVYSRVDTAPTCFPCNRNVLHQMIYYEDTSSNARVFASGAIGGGWTYCLINDTGSVDTDVVRMKTITMNIISHFSGKKYVGKVWTSDPEFALEWHSNIELDGGVEIPQGKYLRAFSPSTITIDSTFAIKGTLEINGSVTIAGKGGINLTNDGKITIMDGATLRLKRGVVLDIEQQGDIEFQGDGTLEIEGEALAEHDVNVTIEAGGTLRMFAGSSFYFGSNALLNVEGSLIANGTADSTVTFTRSSASGQWGGITSDGTVEETAIWLDHANISYVDGVAVHVTNAVHFVMLDCTVDVAACGVEIVPGESASLPNIQLTNNTFTGCTTGIFLYNSSNVNINDSKLYGSDNDGIVLEGSSPTMLRNLITGWKFGLSCYSNSSAMLEEYQNGGNNVITENNTTGVYIEGSEPDLGTITDEEDVGGQNSIFNNGTYDLVIADGSWKVSGRNNWWGNDADPPGVFQIDQESSLDYIPYLPEDPNPSNSLLKGSFPPKAASWSDTSPRYSIASLPELMLLAMKARKRSDLNQAVSLFKQIVESVEMPLFARHWALGQLLAVGQRIRIPRLAEYLASLDQPELARRVKSLLPYSLWSEGSAGQAMAAFDANIREYPNSNLATVGVYGKFVHALYSENDTVRSRSLLNELQASYPKSSEARFAQTQMRTRRRHSNVPTGGLNKAEAGTMQSSVQKPKEFALHQNYPNPFNPSTTINFDLPQPSQVSLVLYDVLGRKVAELMNEQKEAGYHSTIWNASAFASGVYFARFGANSATGRYTKVNKLLLTK